jgi:hypothetical protein
MFVEMKKNSFLIDHVELTSHFQRSIRIDIDLNKEDVLNGYVLQPTAKHVLENLANSLLHSKQSAFTWTGPYGGGKSSLALLLSSLVSPNKKLKQQALSLLEITEKSEIFRAFEGKWFFLPITGSRASIIDLIYSAAEKFLPNFPKPKGRRPKDVIAVLDDYSRQKRCKLLLVIDEMGKVLEHMATQDEDIHFFQDLAERTRDRRGIVTIGILHQSFEQYAQKLGKELRDEWMKVQGRYVDLPLNSTNDETLNLISRAITTNYKHSASREISKVVLQTLKKRKPNLSPDLEATLANCWPLHPIVATVLGPASRKRYGQNERSLFAFLSSVEPKGLREFLEHTKFSEDESYGPAEYWDYLNFNLSAAIQASSDSRLWTLMTDALERSNRFSPKHQRLIKSIAVIELFKESTGLLATNELLETLEIAKGEDLQKLLQSLAQASILVFRKHIDAWALYAGSDFDIETALEESKAEIGEPSSEVLSKLLDPAPVIAKQHYWNSGCLRWFNKQVLTISALRSQNSIKIDDGAGGGFILVLPDDLTSSRKFKDLVKAESKSLLDNPALQHVGVILGIASPESTSAIAELARELAALQLILGTRSELDGDLVARQEVQGRVESAQIALEAQIESAMLEASWTYGGEDFMRFDRNSGLGYIASRVAETVYSHCPKFDNEILNRQSLSSSAVKARKELMYKMLSSENEANLGYIGFSADAGLYGSLLKDRLHFRIGDTYRFICGSSKADENLTKLWRTTESVLTEATDGLSLKQIYDLWEGKPFGLRRGILPVLFFAFYLANREKYALYSESTFLPNLNESHIDELLKFPQEFTLKEVRLTRDQRKLLDELSKSLAKTQTPLFETAPLDVARGLVVRILRLPAWTRRTAEISPETLRVRAVLLAAHDPNALLFHELPRVLGTDDAKVILRELTSAIEELEFALTLKIENIIGTLFKALEEQQGAYKSIKLRAAKLKGTTGDPEVNGFISRLSDYDGTEDQRLQLVSTAARKQLKDLTDADLKNAENQLLAWSLEFKKLELLSVLGGRSKGKYMINLAYGLADKQESAVIQFDVSDESRELAVTHAKQVIALLSKLDRRTQLATLAHTSQLLAGETK